LSHGPEKYAYKILVEVLKISCSTSNHCRHMIGKNVSDVIIMRYDLRGLSLLK
jgi:hypothetical protein